MALARSLLFSLVVLPGTICAGISTFYLFPDCKALDNSYTQYQKLAQANASVRELAIAEAAENRHRINCFAEGVGVLLGWTIAAIGIHGLCTTPQKH